MMFEQGASHFHFVLGPAKDTAVSGLNQSFARKGRDREKQETGWESPEGWKEEQGLSRQLERHRLSPDAPSFCREQAMVAPPAVAPWPISYQRVDLFLIWPSWTHSGRQGRLFSGQNSKACALCQGQTFLPKDLSGVLFV